MYAVSPVKRCASPNTQSQTCRFSVFGEACARTFRWSRVPPTQPLWYSSRSTPRSRAKPRANLCASALPPCIPCTSHTLTTHVVGVAVTPRDLQTATFLSDISRRHPRFVTRSTATRPFPSPLLHPPILARTSTYIRVDHRHGKHSVCVLGCWSAHTIASPCLCRCDSPHKPRHFFPLALLAYMTTCRLRISPCQARL